MAKLSSLLLAIDAKGALAGARHWQVATAKVTAGAKAQAVAIGKADRAMKRAGLGMGQFGKQIKAVMLPMIGLMGVMKSINVIRNFEKSMATLGAVSGAINLQTRETTNAFAEMKEMARELGGTTEFTASQAADAMLNLARAGFTARESLASIKPVLDLATSANIGLAESANIVSEAIRQFSLEAKEASRVADAFLVITNSANTDVTQLAESMKYAGTVAGMMGMSVEETAAVVGVLGDRGLKGSLAGTALRGTLLALAAPTTEARDALHSMGLTVDQVNPAMNSMAEIASALRQGMDNLGSSYQVMGKFQAIFGRRNAAAAGAMATNASRIADLTKAAEESKDAQEAMADVMRDTLTGALWNLNSAIEEAMLTFGDAGFHGVLRSVVDTLTEMVRIVGGVRNAWDEAGAGSKVLAIALGVIVAKATILVGLKLIAFMTGFSLAAWKATFAVNAQASAWARLTLAMRANPIGLIATGIALGVVAIIGLNRHLEDTKRLQEDLKKQSEWWKKSAGDVLWWDKAIQKAGVTLHAAIEAGVGVGQAEDDLAHALSKRLELYEANITALEDLAPDAEIAWKRLEQALLEPYKVGQSGKGEKYSVMTEPGLVDPMVSLMDENAPDDGGERTFSQDVILEYKFSTKGDFAKALEEEAEVIRTTLWAMRRDLKGAMLKENLGIDTTALDYMKKSIGELVDQRAILGKTSEETALNQAFYNVQQQLGVELTEDEAAGIKRIIAWRIRNAKAIKDQAEAERKKIDDSEAAKETRLRIDEMTKARRLEADAIHLVGDAALEAAANKDYFALVDAAVAEQHGISKKQAIALKDAYADLTAEMIESQKLMEVADGIAQSFGQAFDTLIQGSASAKDAFEQFARGVVQAVLDMYAKKPLMDMIKGFIGGWGGGGGGDNKAAGGGSTGVNLARGGAFKDGEPTRYAYGGIVSQPTIFPMASGVGLMGEAGAEAIMPLGRDRAGRLGVRTTDGGAGTTRPIVINMNVQAKDVNSFKRSSAQIENDLYRMTTKLQKRTH